MEAAGIEPEYHFCQEPTDKEVASRPSGRSAYWSHLGGTSRQETTSTGSCDDELVSSIRYIEAAWPKLPSHVKDAIMTLIDSAMLGASK